MTSGATRFTCVAPAIVAHAVGTFLVATNVVIATLLPLIALRTYGARPFELLLMTAAVPTLFTTSIFWQALLRRVSLRRYIAVQWAVGVLPVMLMPLTQQYWQLLICHVVAASGFAGWVPLSGVLLKRLYPDRVRGRAFAVLNAVALGSQIAVYLWAGAWLKVDAEAFRLLIPLLVTGQTAGMLLMAWIADGDATSAAPAVAAASAPRRPAWRALIEPIRRMRAILAADRRFMRYETAFMTYGCGFMIGDALLPLLVTHRLGLEYDQITSAGFATFRGCMLLAALPAGWLLDRVGPMRTASVAFAGLVFYPLLLLSATSAVGLGWASVLYGFMMAGVNLAWMLGPLTLANSADQVSEYVAIHTTLVGIRGVLFQGVGIALYALTDSFVWPLVLAAAMFGLAAWQMWRLHADGQAASLPVAGHPHPPTAPEPARLESEPAKELA
jgi:MFS family permease